MLFEGLVPLRQILQSAASAWVLFGLRFLTEEGDGNVGTNATGLLTLRPDLVLVGRGVYEEEMSESSFNRKTLAMSIDDI